MNPTPAKLNRKRKRQREVCLNMADTPAEHMLNVTSTFVLLQEFSEGELEELAREARLLKKFKAGKV